MKNLVVMKFGGSSVGGAEALRNVVRLVGEHARTNDVIVTASAMNGVTNNLIQAARRASQRDKEFVAESVEQIRTRHKTVCEHLIKKTARLEETTAQLERESRELEKALTALEPHSNKDLW
jgi:aspartokinase